MTVTQKAVLKYRDGRIQNLSLFRVEPTVQRWIIDDSGKEFSKVHYLSTHDAVKGLRVLVETDPNYVGVDLTIMAVEPPPEERAAHRIDTDYDLLSAEAIARIIQEETNISEVVRTAEELLAYLFTRRAIFAKALFPVQGGMAPRDMVMDGLLLGCIEALSKTTKQEYGNLLKILKEPVSNLQVVAALPPKPSRAQ